ncbi:MAG: cation:dicarboxylase symporter family transporter [Clostridiales bacterium]|jgi:L-cystine uptake protein TcyP (sodium:dicarboxylate symporter family)|nr:cation:dicarboxylase symporter family transporter [Clostridiales bacterium]
MSKLFGKKKTTAPTTSEQTASTGKVLNKKFWITFWSAFAGAIILLAVLALTVGGGFVQTLLGLAVFAALLSLIYFLGRLGAAGVGFTLFKKTFKLKFGLSAKVAIALILGLGYGVLLQVFFGSEAKAGAGPSITEWINVVGSGFVKLLQLIIVPLVAVSIINAIGKLGNSKEGSKKAGKIIAFLLVTTAVSAIITIFIVEFFTLFGFGADSLIKASPSAKIPDSVPDTLLNLIPNNLFAGLSSTAVLPVVFIAAVIGFAYLAIRKESPLIAAKFGGFLETVYEFVLKVVEFVIDLTPYGVIGIIAVKAAAGSYEVIAQLGYIVGVSFIALAVVFLLHLLIAGIAGVSPIKYLKKAAPALLFAFSSRSSAATLPLTINAQRRLGVSEANSNLAGTLGTCIGQNGCAGVFPVLLALLVGLSQGWNVWSIYFLVPLVLYAVVASIGTAGVGGGATNVSLLLLSLLGLPVELVAILISVDFIIDMGRTLVNVSDSILAGYIVGKWEKDINKDLLDDKISLEEVLKRDVEINTVITAGDKI